jgi:hypothetical protein
MRQRRVAHKPVANWKSLLPASDRPWINQIPASSVIRASQPAEAQGAQGCGRVPSEFSAPSTLWRYAKERATLGEKEACFWLLDPVGGSSWDSSSCARESAKAKGQPVRASGPREPLNQSKAPRSAPAAQPWRAGPAMAKVGNITQVECYLVSGDLPVHASHFLQLLAPFSREPNWRGGARRQSGPGKGM